MNQENGNSSSDKQDMLYLMGGMALIVLGAGLIMTNKMVRNTVTTGISSVLPQLQGKLVDFSGVGSDIQRYMKLREM